MIHKTAVKKLSLLLWLGSVYVFLDVEFVIASTSGTGEKDNVFCE